MYRYPDEAVRISVPVVNTEPSLRNKKRMSYQRLKRIFDVIGSLALLVILSPVMMLTALLVRISSPGPVIFRQRRLTAGGREFVILKFRTMRQDAESKTGAVWATSGDPRVTSIGSFLRKTRLDELPQLFNVLAGEMSLIGPRPERPEFAKQLEAELPSFNRRLEVKAGITGLAQIGNGYASCLESYRRKLALDRLYVKEQSLMLDLRIALRTIVVVITGDGAK